MPEYSRQQQIDKVIAEEQAKLADIDERRKVRLAKGNNNPPSEGEEKKYKAIEEVIARLKSERSRFKL